MGAVLSKLSFPGFSAPGVVKYAGRIATLCSVISVIGSYAGFAKYSELPLGIALVIFMGICPTVWTIFPLVPLVRLPSRIWCELRQGSTWAHILTVLLKMGAEIDQRSNAIGDALVEGMSLPRPWLWVSAMYTCTIAAAPFSPDIENDADEQYARALLALCALYMDPAVGNLLKDFLSKIKSILASKLDLCLGRLGLTRYRWTYPILKGVFAVASILAIHRLWGGFSDFVQTWLFVRRADYKSWSDPDLWLSLAIRYTLYISIFLLLRARRNFRAAQQQRILEEGFRGPGTPVFASQYAAHGAVKHQVLIVGDVKHELTISRDGAARAQYKHMHFDINHEQRLRAREQGLLTLGKHYVYLIGWTMQAPQQIIDFCNLKISFWVYNVTSHNCQHFIRELADQVIPRDMRARDWTYFRYGAKTAYQRWLLSGWKFRLPLMSAWYTAWLVTLKPWDNRGIASEEPGFMSGYRKGRWVTFLFVTLYLTRFIFGRYV